MYVVKDFCLSIKCMVTIPMIKHDVYRLDNITCCIKRIEIIKEKHNIK